MNLLSSGYILLCLFGWSSILHCTEAVQTLEILLELGDRPGDGYLIEKAEEPTVAAFIKRAKKLCVNGLWGLYSQTSYGSTDILNTTVIPVQGSGRTDCTDKCMTPIMANVNSIRRFGGVDIRDTFFEWFTNKYFLFKDATQHFLVEPTARFETVKSFAITGIAKYYKLCGPTADRCICLDMTRNGPFLVPDLDYFPTTNPLTTLISLSTITTAAECETFERPIGGVRSQRAPLADDV